MTFSLNKSNSSLTIPYYQIPQVYDDKLVEKWFLIWNVDFDVGCTHEMIHLKPQVLPWKKKIRKEIEQETDWIKLQYTVDFFTQKLQ